MAVDPGAPTSTVPVRRAATVAVVDDRPDLHVLLLRRRSSSTFVGNHTLFPGGALDPTDADPAWDDLVEGLDPDDAERRLGRRDEPRAFWIAAVRETLEEAGIVLGVDGADDLVRHRHEIEAGERRLADLLRERALRLDLGRLHPFARWITPENPNRRYDTYFFVARAPEGIEAVPDRAEAVEAAWLRPGEALERWRAGEIILLGPTASTLLELSRHRSADDLLAAARRGGPRRRARLIGTDDTEVRDVLLPEDTDYGADATRSTLGWVWLPRPTP